MLRESVSKLMDRHAPAEYIRRLDREQAYPYDLYDRWAEAGLLKMPFPDEYGGWRNIIDLAIISRDIAQSTISPRPTAAASSAASIARRAPRQRRYCAQAARAK
jgi:alkylation response protein AidB-like acyl-CoA dehydrogenase